MVGGLGHRSRHYVEDGIMGQLVRVQWPIILPVLVAPSDLVQGAAIVRNLAGNPVRYPGMTHEAGVGASVGLTALGRRAASARASCT